MGQRWLLPTGICLLRLDWACWRLLGLCHSSSSSWREQSCPRGMICSAHPHPTCLSTGLAFLICAQDSKGFQLHLCLCRKICFLTSAVSTWTPSCSELQHRWHSSARILWNKACFSIKFCKEIVYTQCFIGEGVSKQDEDLGRSSHRGGSLGSAALISSTASAPATATLRF